MVKDAQGSKAPIQRVVDAMSGYFVPTVMILAILAFMVWYVFGPEPRIIYATIVLVTTLIMRGSEHPLGEAVVKGAEARRVLSMETTDFAAIPGHGVSGSVEGRQVLARQRKADARSR